jgi:hypothetical protein
MKKYRFIGKKKVYYDKKNFYRSCIFSKFSMVSVPFVPFGPDIMLMVYIVSITTFNILSEAPKLMF